MFYPELGPQGQRYFFSGLLQSASSFSQQFSWFVSVSFDIVSGKNLRGFLPVLPTKMLAWKCKFQALILESHFSITRCCVFHKWLIIKTTTYMKLNLFQFVCFWFHSLFFKSLIKLEISTHSIRSKVITSNNYHKAKGIHINDVVFVTIHYTSFHLMSSFTSDSFILIGKV